MSVLRVLFAGTPEVAVPSLTLLDDDPRFEVVAVLTNPDRPRGRSGTPVPSPVATEAGERRIPILRPERVADAAAAIGASGAAVGAVVAYGSILPARVLEALPLGFVNLHFSLLPRWRGAAPVQHAVRAGDPVTGVSAFRLDAGMDTGPVLRRLEVGVPDDADAGDLLTVLAAQGAPVLADGLLAVAAGELGQPQPDVGVTMAPRLAPEDAVVDWREDAASVARRVRSVTPRPGARTTLDGALLKLAGVRVRAEGDAAPPGRVLGVHEGRLEVACGTGTLLVERLQPAGRAWMSAEDALRGRRLAVGTVLGGSRTKA